MTDDQELIRDELVELYEGELTPWELDFLERLDGDLTEKQGDKLEEIRERVT